MKTGRLTSTSLLARNAIWNLMAEGWILLVLIVTMPGLVSSMGATSFGLFSIAWVVIGYLSFLDIGVSRAATKYISEYLAQDDTRTMHEVARTALAINLLLGAAGGLVVAALTPTFVHVFKISGGLESQARLVFYIVALAVPFLLLQAVLRAILTSFQKFGWINSANVLTTTAQWGVGLWLARTGHSVVIVILASVAMRILATAAYAMIVLQTLPNLDLVSRRGFTGLSKLLQFGGWVTLSQFISPVLVYLDRLLIGSLVSLAAVTLYTVPYEVMTRLRIIPSSLATTLYPAFSERATAGQEGHLQRLYEGSVRYLLLVVLPGILFLVVVGPDLMSIWMGAAFSRDTSRVLQALALGVLANAMAYLPYNMLQAAGRPDLTGKFHLAELPLYAVLALTLIPKWGIGGAAMASLIRFVIDAALLFWAAERYCHCSLETFCKESLPKIGLLGCGLLPVLIATRVIFGYPWLRVGIGGAATGLSILVATTWIMDRHEKPKIGEALRTLLGQSAA